MPFTYTGADFYALCSDAMLKAVTRQAARVDAKIKALNASPERTAGGRQQISTAYFFDHYATPEDVEVMVMEHDFMEAHQELIPSVSAGELAHYERVRAAFEGGRDKQQNQQRRDPSLPPLLGSLRTVSSGSSVKGKGKAVAAASAGKGKGKAVAVSSSDEEDGGPAGSDTRVPGSVNGSARNHGKGEAVATDPLHGPGGDDEGLYD